MSVVGDDSDGDARSYPLNLAVVSEWRWCRPRHSFHDGLLCIPLPPFPYYYSTLSLVLEGRQKDGCVQADTIKNVVLETPLPLPWPVMCFPLPYHNLLYSTFLPPLASFPPLHCFQQSCVDGTGKPPLVTRVQPLHGEHIWFEATDEEQTEDENA